MLLRPEWLETGHFILISLIDLNRLRLDALIFARLQKENSPLRKRLNRRQAIFLETASLSYDSVLRAYRLTAKTKATFLEYGTFLSLFKTIFSLKNAYKSALLAIKKNRKPLLFGACIHDITKAPTFSSNKNIRAGVGK